MLQYKRTNRDNPDFQKLIIGLDLGLRQLYQRAQSKYDTFNQLSEEVCVIVASFENDIAGCGAFRPNVEAQTVEIKRMYVDPKFRGKGIGMGILMELEEWAQELAFQRAILETGNKQIEAIGLYKKAGYQLIENYGPYAHIASSICFSKQL